ncbi:hypothetical protein NSA53_07865 [Cellulosimicrobium cellulans]|uniref:hypothetical protein n=1 Tax=Cellulosimicrobium cellulans TaxID=1710 RepID=UPI00214A1274|nr:hypothetical protein [Cellulosimicrobium cellulans]
MNPRARWASLRPTDRTTLRTAATVVGLGILLTTLGASPAHALTLTALGIAATLLRHRTGYAGDTVWPHLPTLRRDGNRRDVSDLAWSVLGRDGRVTPTAARRMRHLTDQLLARHGTGPLDDPTAAPAVAHLLGPRVARTAHDLTTTGRLPTPAELHAWLTALDRLPTTPERPDEGTPR